MNFRRIEIVFVIAFIGLNLFLFALYRNNSNALSTARNTTQTEAIETLLSNNNITFSGEFSQEKLEGYYLSGEQTSWINALSQLRNETGNQDLFTQGISVSDDTLTNTLSNRQMLNKEELANGVAAFLGYVNLVPFGTEYTYLQKLTTQTDDSELLVASQNYEGLPFNDATAQIRLTLTEDEDSYVIESYTATHIDNIETLREKMELASERDAVTTLYTNNRLPADSEILWTQLAYSRIMQVRGKNVYVPVWFVAIRNGDSGPQIESVNAISNSVIVSSSITVVES